MTKVLGISYLHAELESTHDLLMKLILEFHYLLWQYRDLVAKDSDSTKKLKAFDYSVLAL
jgi:hypothetical protein